MNIITKFTDYSIKLGSKDAKENEIGCDDYDL